MHFKTIVLLLLMFATGPIAMAQENQFPNDWVGLWSGQLEIYKGVTKVNSLPMSLEISPLDESGTYKYYITYGEGDGALRPYLLKTVDKEAGRYILDEDNGIQIEMYLLDKKLVSAFDVQGSFIQTTLNLREHNTLVYEIFAGSSNPVSITGDTIIGTDTIPPVNTYPMNVLQRAILSKNKR